MLVIQMQVISLYIVTSDFTIESPFYVQTMIMNRLCKTIVFSLPIPILMWIMAEYINIVKKNNT